jgi:hypothetical protein
MDGKSDEGNLHLKKYTGNIWLRVKAVDTILSVTNYERTQ